MRKIRQSALYILVLPVAVGLAFVGGWFTGQGTAKEVRIDPSRACLASSQYAGLVLSTERQERLIRLNQEGYSAEKVRALYQENEERKQHATALWNSFEDQCQGDLQDPKEK